MLGVDPDAPTPPDGLPEAPTPPDGSPVTRAAGAAAPVVPDTGAQAAVSGRDTGSHRAVAARVRPAGEAAVRTGGDPGTGGPRTRTGGHPIVDEEPAGRRAPGDERVERTDSHRARSPADRTGGHPIVDGEPAASTGADAAVDGSPARRTGSHRARRPAHATAAHRARSSDARDVPAETATGPTPPAPHAGHGHGHGPPAPAARRVRIVIACLLVPAAIATLVGLVLLYPFAGRPAPADGAAALPRVAGEVTAATQADCGNEPGDAGCIALTVVLEEGVLAGNPITVLTSAPQPGRAGTAYAVGDPVELVWNGDPADPASYEVSDFQRDTPLLVLALVFAVAVVALGRWRGLAALVALGLTAVVLIAFVLPAILAGRSPLAVAVVGSCAIMFGVLYLTHGVSARTSTAVLGTLASLLLIGLLGVVFAAAARLTGLDEDTANLTVALGTDVDARGLVLAGLVIGALGALDDVTVTQTSAVWELRGADPHARPAALFGAAMRIGRDHVASAVNTLVLAYAGAALPLLLLFAVAQRGLGDALTTQVIATEVVRTLVGSIGIVASVPLTTALAVAVSARGRAA